MSSPLLRVLEDGVERHELVLSPDRTIYTGFANFADLCNSDCMFCPMNSNRAINLDVVEERVEANRKRMVEVGSFCDFGQINLLVMRSDPTRTFYVMDGQHRCMTMEKLVPLNRPITFQFRAKVVQSEAEAAEELKHFQNSYPSDPRSFFPTQRMTKLATEVLGLFKKKFQSPDLFRKVELSSRVGKRVGDPARPFLTDYVFFGILTDSKLLETCDSVDQVMDQLIAMEEILANSGNDLRKLGPGMTKNIFEKAKQLGCHIGLFRPGKLEWKSLQNRLPALKNGKKHKRDFVVEVDEDYDEKDEDEDEYKPEPVRKKKARIN